MATMSATRVMLIGAILWATAFILSAFILRGRALGDWIEGLLLVVWIVFFSYWAGKEGRK
jgi:Ca2+/Na+ antiporter